MGSPQSLSTDWGWKGKRQRESGNSASGLAGADKRPQRHRVESVISYFALGCRSLSLSLSCSLRVGTSFCLSLSVKKAVRRKIVERERKWGESGTKEREREREWVQSNQWFFQSQRPKCRVCAENGGHWRAAIGEQSSSISRWCDSDSAAVLGRFAAVLDLSISVVLML